MSEGLLNVQGRFLGLQENQLLDVPSKKPKPIHIILSTTCPNLSFPSLVAKFFDFLDSMSVHFSGSHFFNFK